MSRKGLSDDRRAFRKMRDDFNGRYAAQVAYAEANGHGEPPTRRPHAARASVAPYIPPYAMTYGEWSGEATPVTTPAKHAKRAAKPLTVKPVTPAKPVREYATPAPILMGTFE